MEEVNNLNEFFSYFYEYDLKQKEKTDVEITNTNQYFKEHNKELEERKNKLEVMKTKLSNVNNPLKYITVNNLLEKIDNEIDSINSITKISNLILDNKDNEDDFEKILDLENNFKTIDESLNKAVNDANIEFTEYLKVKFEEKKPADEDDIIIDVIDVGKQKDGTKENNKKTEQNSIKEKKGKDILDERLNAVEYQKGMDYSEKLNKIRIEYEIEQLEAELNNISKNEDKNKKMTFKEAVAKQAVLNKIELLKAEYDALKNVNKNQNEIKLEKTFDKINDKYDQLNLEVQKQQEMNSHLFRYISSRKQKTIDKKLNNLNSKMSNIMSNQMTKTGMKFDKVNKKLTKQSLSQAKRDVVKAELISLKDKLVNEATAINRDITRFVSKSELIDKLKQSEVVMIAKPKSLGITMKTEKEETRPLVA